MNTPRKSAAVLADGSKSFWFRVNDTPELRAVSVFDIHLSEAVANLCHRCGLDTMGDIIDNWHHLKECRPSDSPSGIGVTTVKKIHAAAFAYMINDDPGDSVRIVAPQKDGERG